MKRRVLFLALLLALLSPAPAAAQENTTGGPVLQQANVRVEPGRSGVAVVERLVVTNPGDGSVEHVLARSEGAGVVADLTVRANGRELDFGRERGELLDKISVPVPSGTGEGFAYEVSYTYTGDGESAKVPLVVPAVPTVEDASNVTLGLALPKDRHLHESFPVLEGDRGTPTTSMTSFPSFASYETGSTPGGLFTASSAYTALALVVIFGCVVGLLVYDRRSGRGEVASA